MKHQRNQTNRKRRKKPLIIILCIIAVIVALLGGYLLCIHFMTGEYYANSEQAFRYPQLEDGLIPQGISYEEKTDSFFICGYKTGGKPCAAYVINRSDGAMIASASLMKQDGADFRGHAGGIGVYGDYVYVAGTDDGVYVYSRDAILNARDGEPVQAEGLFPVQVGDVQVRASFLSVNNGMLTVGEFRMGFIITSPESHHFTTPGGEHSKALAVSYPLDENMPLGVDPQAAAVYTLPTRAQGICFTDGKVIVSTSLVFLMSDIYVYDADAVTAFAEIDGVPVYALDQEVRTAAWRFPPMAEEIEYVDGKIYTICESACNSYQFGKLFGAQWCFSTDYEWLKQRN